AGDCRSDACTRLARVCAADVSRRSRRRGGRAYDRGARFPGVGQKRRQPGAHAGDLCRARTAPSRRRGSHWSDTVKFGLSTDFGRLLTNALRTTRSTFAQRWIGFSEGDARLIAEGARRERRGYNSAEGGVTSSVEKSIRTELVERVAASEPIARKLDAIQKAQWPVRF